MIVLETKNLTKNFGGLAAVNGLNLQVEKGQLFGLIGPNGSGKSTFFNVVTGVFPPSRGKIFFDGEEITRLKPHKIAEKGIARNFQADVNLSAYTVLDNVAVSSHLLSRTGVFSAMVRSMTYRTKQAAVLKRANEVIEFAGLGGLKGELAKNLPHGHQRMLGIAMAIAIKPKLLLLDEPISGLSHTEIEGVMDLILRLRNEGNTIILIDHNMKVVMNYCDYIAVIDHGIKIAEGTPAEIVNNKAVIEAYLGVEENVT